MQNALYNRIGYNYNNTRTNDPYITETIYKLIVQNPKSTYLDAAIRKGISSFTSLANREEVENGLKKLEQDISSCMFYEVKESYNSNYSDYLFFTAQKPESN